jgi:GntR family transcriptional regulator/MocR family aminotransferase
MQWQFSSPTEPTTSRTDWSQPTTGDRAFVRRHTLSGHSARDGTPKAIVVISRRLSCVHRARRLSRCLVEIMLKRANTLRRSQASLLPSIRVDKGSARPMYWQIYDEVKRLVVDGVIPGGTSMPSPRLVASEFGCSRHTVATAYDYLVAEGILVTSHGVGTFVSNLPGLPINGAWVGARLAHVPRALDVSRFAAKLERVGSDRDEEDPLQRFGTPDTERFPWELWSKIHTRVWSRPERTLLQSSSAQGYAGLRRAICDLAHRTRGIRATPDQVLITAGTTQSLDLLLRALLDPGNSIWLEDPGRPKAKMLVKALGMTPIAVPVDEHGLQVDVAEEQAQDAKAVLITASHHYPTGATLSLERRIRLLSWANRTGGWIFEDDYDGEIIADGRPILPIYSLGQNDRVVYMGTFSKSISPQLRLGYLICHPNLVRLLVTLRYFIDYFPPMNIQPVLAEFINGGHLESHIRRMRRTYRERQARFTSEIKTQGADEFALFPSAPTLFQTLGMRDTPDVFLDRELAQRARKIGIPANALSSFYFQAPPRPGVIVGTGRLDIGAIPTAVNRLVAASREIRAAR